MTPLIPEPYVPRTYIDLQEQVAEVLAEHITRMGIRGPQIARRYPTCRQGDIARLKNPDAPLMGVKRMLSMAEACGLKIKFEVTA
jgi:hypothetical protein